jgi:hypothetical protein
MKIRSLVLGAVLAASAFAGLAPRAAAQSGPVVYEYGTMGGFTAFSIDMKVYGDGTVVCDEHYHNGTTVEFTGWTDVSDLDALVPANFASLPAALYRAHWIPDVASVFVAVDGKRVSVLNAPHPAGAASPDAAFDAFAAKLSGVFSAVGSAELCSFQSYDFNSGDWVSLTVTNDGRCHLTEQGAKNLDKDGWVALADMQALRADFARKNSAGQIWAQYPDVLGYGNGGDWIAVTLDDASGGKEVDSATGVREPRTYLLVHAQLSSIITKVEAQ